MPTHQGSVGAIPATSSNTGKRIGLHVIPINSSGEVNPDSARLDAISSVLGTVNDAAITAGSTGTISGKQRGLLSINADIWDSVNHRLNVAVMNTPVVSAVLTAGAQATPTTMQNAAVANANGTSLDVRGYTGAVLLITGSMSGGTEVDFEVSPDGALNWNTTFGYLTADATLQNGSPVTATGLYVVDVPPGMGFLRARIANYSAGSVTIVGYPALLPVNAQSVTWLAGIYATVSTGTMQVTPAAGSTWNARVLQSSAADLQMTATPAAGSTWNVRPLQSSAADLQVTATIGTNLQSTVAPSSGSSGLVVRQVIDSLLTLASTNAFASTLLVINSTATGQKCKVFAYSITSTDATSRKIAFYRGSSMIWPVVLQAISSAISGANLAVSPPAYLFTSAAASSVTLRTPSSFAGCKVAVSYFMAP